MNNIHVKVYVTKKVRTPPISVVYGSTGVGIEIEVMDYSLPAGSTAEARATGKFAAKVYKNPCTVDGNIITMYPEAGFFVPGGNEFQVVITGDGKNILSFVMDAVCDKDIGEGNDLAKPEQVLPLVQRAENAATQSEAAAARAEDVKGSIPADYTELSGGVNRLKSDYATLADSVSRAISPVQRYKTIPGKAFNGWGNLTEYDDAFLVLLEVPADCAFLIVTKFNYPVAFGDGFQYSTPKYLDADCNRISSCKVNNDASVIGNSNDFGIITLVNVPENAAYIAIPYKNGTQYSVEYGYVHYADRAVGNLIDGHLPYGIQLFEDGRNLVQKLFMDTGYLVSNSNFNFFKGSTCTQPVLYNGGARIYHDGVANTMVYFAFDNDNNFIREGRIDSGRELPEIENAAYLIFQSDNDFTWISYSDLNWYGYKQYKKIRDDALDLHITRKKLEYPYHGMAASFLGDSLTGNGSGGDYITCLNDFFGFSSITNCGIGGTKISGETKNAMWKDSRINALDIDSDIIFVMGGTNDAPSGKESPDGSIQYLGDITPDNHDTNTFVGAYNVLLSKIYYRYGLVDGLYDGIDYSGVVQAETARDIRILLITPPQRFPGTDNEVEYNYPAWHYVANTDLYADAVLKIGLMHGIPVADVRGCAGVNIFNRDRYICGPDVPNRNGSGVHLSKDAHKRWAEVIIGKMLETVF